MATAAAECAAINTLLPAGAAASDAACCATRGIVCDGAAPNMHIASITLNQRNLTGPLPADWSPLQSLRAIDLSNNNLTGTVPASLSSLPQLQSFVLARNPNLSGPVPDAFARTGVVCDLYGTAICKSLVGTNKCCPSSSPNTAPPASDAGADGGRQLTPLEIAGFVGAVAVGFALIVAAVYLIRRLTGRGRRESDSLPGPGPAAGFREYDVQARRQSTPAERDARKPPDMEFIVARPVQVTLQRSYTSASEPALPPTVRLSRSDPTLRQRTPSQFSWQSNQPAAYQYSVYSAQSGRSAASLSRPPSRPRLNSDASVEVARHHQMQQRIRSQRSTQRSTQMMQGSAYDSLGRRSAASRDSAVPHIEPRPRSHSLPRSGSDQSGFDPPPVPPVPAQPLRERGAASPAPSTIERRLRGDSPDNPLRRARSTDRVDRSGGGGGGAGGSSSDRMVSPPPPSPLPTPPLPAPPIQYQLSSRSLDRTRDRGNQEPTPDRPAYDLERGDGGSVDIPLRSMSIYHQVMKSAKKRDQSRDRSVTRTQ